MAEQLVDDYIRAMATDALYDARDRGLDMHAAAEQVANVVAPLAAAGELRRQAGLLATWAQLRARADELDGGHGGWQEYKGPTGVAHRGWFRNLGTTGQFLEVKRHRGAWAWQHMEDKPGGGEPLVRSAGQAGEPYPTAEAAIAAADEYAARLATAKDGA